MTTFLLIILVALIIVFGLDVRQKRRAVLESLHSSLGSLADNKSEPDAAAAAE